MIYLQYNLQEEYFTFGIPFSKNHNIPYTFFGREMKSDRIEFLQTCTRNYRLILREGPIDLHQAQKAHQ